MGGKHHRGAILAMCVGWVGQRERGFLTVLGSTHRSGQGSHPAHGGSGKSPLMCPGLPDGVLISCFSCSDRPSVLCQLHLHPQPSRLQLFVFAGMSLPLRASGPLHRITSLCYFIWPIYSTYSEKSPPASTLALLFRVEIVCYLASWTRPA